MSRERALGLIASIVVLLTFALGGTPSTAQTGSLASVGADAEMRPTCAVGQGGLTCRGDWAAPGYCDGIGGNC